MEKLSGNATCPKDGNFPWRGYHIKSGEYISLEWSKDVQNFGHISDDGNGIVICPKCGAHISVRLSI